MSLPTRVNPGDRLSADTVNRANETLAKFERLSGGNGVKVAVTPGGASISGAVSTRALREPAIEVRALNDSNVTLPAYSPCGLSGHVLEGANAQQQRVLRVRVPTDDDAGRFAITAEPIQPGRVGRVYIAGLCLCKIQNGGEAGELLCAEIEAEADYLVAKNSGGAQIIWENTFEGDEIHLGLVRFPRGGGDIEIFAADGYRATNVGSKTGAITTEGQTITDGTIFLRGQTNPAQNGVWQVSDGPWSFIGQPKIVHILKGTFNGGGSWRLTAANTYSPNYDYWG